MKGSETLFVTMPEYESTANKFSRVAPNEGHFPIDATVTVLTEDGHEMRFAVLRKGDQQPEALLSLASCEPPITTMAPYEKEVFVKGDRIIEGRDFELVSAFPIFLGRAVFKAMHITANVAMVEVPIFAADMIEAE
jgi:small nuclear ribonucleoprotein (snRNP)-like protein